MASGTIKWFHPGKYGFIVPDDGSKDVFVHRTAVEAAGYVGLLEGVRWDLRYLTKRLRTKATKTNKIGPTLLPAAAVRPIAMRIPKFRVQILQLP
jgi:CspA family cold shock protein